MDKSTSGGGGYSMTIGECASILSDCHIGDSICVNGELVLPPFFVPRCSPTTAPRKKEPA